jgi:S1-C subfamily serine protease
MVEKTQWEVPLQRQPRPEEVDFDLDGTLRSVVGLQSVIPDDAFTATTLGTERSGSGVVIGDGGLVLTIGYLITEAESVWITGGEGRVTPGHALAYDQETGFGLVQALGRLGLPALPLGRSAAAAVGDRVVVAGAGRQQSLSASIIAKSEFAGYWEYLLDEAIFTAPAHPFWGGTGLIGSDGRLLGIGSLHVQQMAEAGMAREVNMIVPIDLLNPILGDLLAYGRVNKPARPWLGLFAAESEGKIVVADVASRGPAALADIRRGDSISAIGDAAVASLADFYRRIWASGSAGVEIPIELVREGRARWVRVISGDRTRFLKAPRLQ